MNWIRSTFLIFAMAAPSLAAAQTMNFEDSTALLATSCGTDIDSYCRGVNLDSTRLKDCLARNQDGISPNCKADYGRAFDAIQQRLKARAAVSKTCERDALKFCKDEQKQAGKVLQCLLAAPRGMSVACNQAINAAGYR
jgi:hypothetical protein